MSKGIFYRKNVKKCYRCEFKKKKLNAKYLSTKMKKENGTELKD